MQLIIDIGNSNVVIGIFKENQWLHTWRLPTMRDEEALLFYEMRLTDYLLEADFSPKWIDQVVVSSVVPDLKDVFSSLSIRVFRQEAVVVGPDIYPQIALQIDRPDEIGTDLLANAIAAKDLYQCDAIVVDFGTALTFTTVTKQGHILGVAIAPGLKTAISALYDSTAQLPEVPLELPDSPVGKNTVHAIQSGILIGYVGLVRHMLYRIREEVGKDYKAIATGGLAAILHPLKAEFDIVAPFLTLDGLRIIGTYVQKDA
jgi:type III pantothenate kinase